MKYILIKYIDKIIKFAYKQMKFVWEKPKPSLSLCGRDLESKHYSTNNVMMDFDVADRQRLGFQYNLPFTSAFTMD